MTHSTPKFAHEIRIGLVVYGGVSLAVYMNGVCREFYNAVRGRGVYKLIKALTDSDIVVDIISGTSAGGINGVLLAYCLANSTQEKAWDFKNFAGVWRESGNINKLLRNSERGKEADSLFDGEGYYQEELTKAFHNFVNANNDRDDNEADPSADWFSPFNELDLFITGTDTLGRVAQQFDNTGKVIEVKRHEAVFLLKHRLGRKTSEDDDWKYQPFKPDQNDMDKITERALAKLCRITSCFPVAFPVVSVTLDKSAESDWLVDERLIRWGQLDKGRILPKENKQNTRQLHFVDGGVLDNRPFGYTIREIYSRHFTRPVTRLIFYIDPSPDKFINSPEFTEMQRPSIWKAAVDSLVTLPRYESIAEDLNQITNLNNNVRSYRFLRQLEIDKFKQQWDDTQDNKINKDGDTAASDYKESDHRESHYKEVYIPARLASMRDRILHRLMDDGDGSQRNTRLEKAARQLTTAIKDQTARKERAKWYQDRNDDIKDIDVAFFIRKHFFIVYQISEALGDSSHAALHPQLEELAHSLNTQLSLLEVISASLDKLMSEDPIKSDFASFFTNETLSDWDVRRNSYRYLIDLHRVFLNDDLDKFCTDDDRGCWSKIQDSLINEKRTLGSGDEYEYDHASKLYQILKKKVARISEGISEDRKSKRPWPDLPGVPQAKDSDQKTILSRINDISRQQIAQLHHHFQQPPRLEAGTSDLFLWLKYLFDNFNSIDERLYPYEYLSNLQTEDLTKIIRISPEDANRGFGKDKQLEERLAGVQLRAFGAFLKQSWRSNDILWGRLDGLNRLVDALLTTETLVKFPFFLKRYAGDLDEPGEIIDRLLNEAFPDRPDLTKLRELLLQLFKSIDVEKMQLTDDQYLSQLATQVTKQEYIEKLKDELKDEIVHAGQMSILQSDLQYVLEDVVKEQLDWNIQLLGPKMHSREVGSRSEADSDSKKSSYEEMKDQLLPRFEPIQGFIEPALSGFISAELIKPVNEMLSSPEKLEEYFRNKYKVGSEKFITHVPPLIREKLLARSGLVLRSILDSGSTGKALQGQASYQLFGNLLQTYKHWVDIKNPGNYALPAFLFQVLPLVGVLLVIGLLAYVVSMIPAPFLVATITLLLVQFLYSLIAGPNLTQKGLKTFIILSLGSMLLSFILGLPWPDSENILRLSNLIAPDPHCPLIHTPWMSPKCL